MLLVGWCVCFYRLVTTLIMTNREFLSIRWLDKRTSINICNKCCCFLRSALYFKSRGTFISMFNLYFGDPECVIIYIWGHQCLLLYLSTKDPLFKSGVLMNSLLWGQKNKNGYLGKRNSVMCCLAKILKLVCVTLYYLQKLFLLQSTCIWYRVWSRKFLICWYFPMTTVLLLFYALLY